MAPVSTSHGAAAAWSGSELFEHPDWLAQLTERELRELEACAAHAPEVREEPETAALDRRRATLDRALEHGPGAVLVRGLELGGRDDRDCARLFSALVSPLGTALSQNARGERLLRVEDAGYAETDPRTRGPFSSRRLHFHSDRCDLIAFLCVRPAAAGGETHLLDARALRRRMAARHPRLLEVLERPFPYLRHTIDPGHERPFVELPVFSEHEGHFACCFLRVLIDRAHAAPGAPDLAPEQIEALDALEREAEDPDLYAALRLAPGDVLLLNNWTILHRRTAFEDSAETGRLLLRMWISSPSSRPLAPCFAAHFGSSEAGALRGGIWPPGGRPAV